MPSRRTAPAQGLEWMPCARLAEREAESDGAVQTVRTAESRRTLPMRGETVRRGFQAHNPWLPHRPATAVPRPCGDAAVAPQPSFARGAVVSVSRRPCCSASSGVCYLVPSLVGRRSSVVGHRGRSSSCPVRPPPPFCFLSAGRDGPAPIAGGEHSAPACVCGPAKNFRFASPPPALVLFSSLRPPSNSSLSRLPQSLRPVDETVLSASFVPADCELPVTSRPSTLPVARCGFWQLILSRTLEKDSSTPSYRLESHDLLRAASRNPPFWRPITLVIDQRVAKHPLASFCNQHDHHNSAIGMATAAQP
jgi:hypothetical protein